MTEEQKFLFDVKGWLLLPGVLAAAEIDAVKGESVKAIARALSPPGVCSRIH